ncbi:hypothetical protein SGPA1_10762 [Streptomyces misionensis JCM 4497]
MGGPVRRRHRRHRPHGRARLPGRPLHLGQADGHRDPAGPARPRTRLPARLRGLRPAHLRPRAHRAAGRRAGGAGGVGAGHGAGRGPVRRVDAALRLAARGLGALPGRAAPGRAADRPVRHRRAGAAARRDGHRRPDHAGGAPGGGRGVPLDRPGGGPQPPAPGRGPAGGPARRSAGRSAPADGPGPSPALVERGRTGPGPAGVHRDPALPAAAGRRGLPHPGVLRHRRRRPVPAARRRLPGHRAAGHARRARGAGRRRPVHPRPRRPGRPSRAGPGAVPLPGLASPPG